MKIPKFFIADTPNCFRFEPVAPMVLGNYSGYMSISEIESLTGAIKGRVTVGSKWTDWGDFFCGIGSFNNSIRRQMEAVGHLPTCNPIRFVEIEPSRLRTKPAPDYEWFHFPRHIDTRQPEGGGEYTFVSDSPLPKPLFYFNRQGCSFVFCDIRAVLCARKFSWKEIVFHPIDLVDREHINRWKVSFLGAEWPPQWWPEGHEPHPSNVIEAEVPDVKVGEGLVGEFAPPPPRPAKQKASAKLRGPLLAPEAIQGLKLKEAGLDLVGKVRLGRPLYGSKTLEVSVCLDELDEGQRAAMGDALARAKAALGRLEALLPRIDARLLEEGRPYASSPEEFLDTVHSPSVHLMAADFAAGDKWNFSVESDIVGFDFEFEGEQLLDVCIGD